MTDDHHSGPHAQMTAVRHHEASYSRQRRGRDDTVHVRRFLRNLREAAENTKLLHDC
jgi:hypothetical protein